MHVTSFGCVTQQHIKKHSTTTCMRLLAWMHIIQNSFYTSTLVITTLFVSYFIYTLFFFIFSIYEMNIMRFSEVYIDKSELVNMKKSFMGINTHNATVGHIQCKSNCVCSSVIESSTSDLSAHFRCCVERKPIYYSMCWSWKQWVLLKRQKIWLNGQISESFFFVCVYIF